MSKLSKLLITIVVVVIFIALFAIVAGISSDAGRHTPGIIGLILFAAVIGAVRAIWKSDDNDKDEKNDSDKGILQK